MVFNKQSGKITACGWNINSELLRNDIPLSAHTQSGGGSSALQTLAVPAGLIILKNMIDSNTKTSLYDLLEEPKVIGEDLYDKLLDLAGRKKRSIHNTRRKRGKTKREKIKNKTRKK